MLVCARMLRALILAFLLMAIPGAVPASDLDDPFPIRDQLPKHRSISPPLTASWP